MYVCMYVRAFLENIHVYQWGNFTNQFTKALLSLDGITIPAGGEVSLLPGITQRFTPLFVLFVLLLAEP